MGATYDGGSSNVEGKKFLIKASVLGIFALAVFATFALPPMVTGGTLPPFSLPRQEETIDRQSFPLLNLPGELFTFPTNPAPESFKTVFVLEDQQLVFTSFPVEQESGLVLLEASRGPYEFPTKVKLLAWGRAIASGQIPENANPDDYHFHHVITVALLEKLVATAATEEAAARLIAYARSVDNAYVIHVDDHKDLHREYTEAELYEIAMNGMLLSDVIALLSNR